MALKFKEEIKKRKRSKPDEGFFKRSKAKLCLKGSAKMTTKESEPMHKQKEVTSKGKKTKVKEAFPIHREVTIKKNGTLKSMRFNKARTSNIEFKKDKTFGAGTVSGTIHGDKGGKGLTGKVATSRAGSRSLGNQEDKKNSDSKLEAKGRKWARKRSKGKADKQPQKIESMTNHVSNNKSTEVKSGRKITNKVTEVVSRFKRSKSARK